LRNNSDFKVIKIIDQNFENEDKSLILADDEFDEMNIENFIESNNLEDF
jgi:hypothetical protein